MARPRIRRVDGGIDSSVDGAEDGTFTADPTEISAGTEAGTGDGNGDGNADPKRRRGRKPGSRQKAASVSVNVSAVESLLFSLHLMAANMMDAPYMALEQSEAAALAKAVADVSDHYGMGALGVWGNLTLVAGGIYGPRFAAAIWQKKAAKQAETLRELQRAA